MIRHLLIIAVLLSACALPVAAVDTNWSVDSFFDITYDLSGQQIQAPINATGTAVVRGSQPDPTGTYDTEMLSMSLTGSGGPFGTVMIRESPTRASTGRLIGDPDFDLLRVDSFFDVFTEISLDGGQTWSYNVSPAHYSAVGSFFDIIYDLDSDVQLIGDGHVTVLKYGSSLHMTQDVPEPGSIAALLTGFVGLAGFGIRRRKTR